MRSFVIVVVLGFLAAIAAGGKSQISQLYEILPLDGWQV